MARVRVPSKNVQIAAHGYHAVTMSRERRGARYLVRIKLFPLKTRGREPKEVIQ